mmetsp:Transcript_43705/g.81520  ORF Transcript_43705/g.81520 Transcript_43705/m.81520 type:complete len:275 (+) Transcript_43705:63-887(+)
MDLADLADGVQDAFCPSYPSSVKHEARLLVLVASPFSGCLAMGLGLLGSAAGWTFTLLTVFLQIFYYVVMAASGHWYWKDKDAWTRTGWIDAGTSNRILEIVCFSNLGLYVLPCLVLGDPSNLADMLVLAGLGFLLLYLPCLDKPFPLCLLFSFCILVTLVRLPMAQWDEWRNLFFCATHLMYFVLISHLARSRMQQTARLLQSPLQAGASNILTRIRRIPRNDANPSGERFDNELQEVFKPETDGNDATSTGSDVSEEEIRQRYVQAKAAKAG